MELLNKLLDSTDPKSSKIFIALIAFALFFIVVVVAFFGIILPDVYIYCLLTLIVGQSALEIFPNNKIKPPSNDV